jgi:hypothetical protein
MRLLLNLRCSTNTQKPARESDVTLGTISKCILRTFAASLLLWTLVFPSNLKAITTANQIPQSVKSSPQEAGYVLPEVLLKIAYCESSNQQFNKDGTVLRGKVNPLDRGRYQINLHWNGADAKKLGYDLNTWDGNTAYALVLFQRHGTRDWTWSAKCWQRPLSMIMKEKGLGK